MKKRTFLMILLLLFAVEIVVLLAFAVQDMDNLQDAVVINEAVQSVQSDWNSIENHENQTDLEYVVLDADGSHCFAGRHACAM